MVVCQLPIWQSYRMLEPPSRHLPSAQSGTSLSVPDDLEVEAGYLVGRAEAFIGASRAANTVRGYESDWRHFVGWCARHHAPSLPADPRLVALYLTSLAEGRREKGETARRRPNLRLIWKSTA